MRALFIYPNINTQVGFNYGISYISGFLRSRGIETGSSTSTRNSAIPST
jgi:hypothetical protein